MVSDLTLTNSRTDKIIFIFLSSILIAVVNTPLFVSFSRAYTEIKLIYSFSVKIFNGRDIVISSISFIILVILL